MADLCPFDVRPLAVPRFVNNLPVYSLNYTSQDFHSIRNRALDLIKSNFEEEFNDINESSLAIMLVECWSAMADMLSFKIDQLANELYIDTVTEIENAFRLAKLVGFRPMPPLPAKTMFLARMNRAYAVDVVLKTPIQVSLDGIGFDVIYELFPADANNNPVFDSEIIIPAGSLFTENVIGLEGITNRISFNSTGKANQIFTLPHENVFAGSINVKINGIAWEETDYFTQYKVKPEYIVDYDAFYKASLVFGDNKAGLVPPPGAKIGITYRVPNKISSEIISGAFDTKVLTGIDGLEDNVVVYVKNYTKSEFGYPGDGITDIKKKLPAFIRSQNRAVTGADYKFLIENFTTPHDGCIGKSNIVLRNHGCAGNVIDVIILGRTIDYRLVKANDNLKKSLLEELNKRKMFTDNICVKDGEVIYVDISINIHLNKVFKRLETEIRNKITDRIEEYFDLTNWEFGYSLKEKDIIKHLADIKEVKQFDIGFTTAKSIDENKGIENIVTARYNEIPRPDNITINFTYSDGVN